VPDIAYEAVEDWAPLGIERGDLLLVLPDLPEPVVLRRRLSFHALRTIPPAILRQVEQDEAPPVQVGVRRAGVSAHQHLTLVKGQAT
jgi:hypothetical protein